MEDFIKKSLNKLEYDKVLAKLSDLAVSEGAKALCGSAFPCSDIGRARALLDETDSAYKLMAQDKTPSFAEICDITECVNRSEMGGMLSFRELLSVGRLLSCVQSLVKYAENNEQRLGALSTYFERLIPIKPIKERIEASIISEDEMADSASPELYDIRRSIKAANAKVRESLQKMISSTHYQQYLQEPIVTMRGGRYVLPVKAEYKKEVNGLVHDASASGATLFIEPLAVVSANNEIKTLLGREEKEIERILYEISAQIAEHSQTILIDYDTAVRLDYIFARAKLAYEQKATRARLNDRGEIYIKRARHPLIDPKVVVAVDVRLGKDFDTLVVTGPNTGGKTVTLKTIGLLCLMGMTGLFIPAADDSELSVFDRVLADIGDEQSIEQSLSTFSSHMKNIVSIIDAADGSTLALFDELGAGTDPVEGAALAVSIIENVRSKGAKIAATTHYAELKVYALSTPGVENASCEFDIQTLRPTYRLLIGVPGRSNAFAISTRLGLENSIVEQAKTLIGQESRRFEDVISALEESRIKSERERENAEKMRLDAQRMNTEIKERFDKVNMEKAKLIEEARKKALDIISDAKQEAEAAQEEIRRALSEENKQKTQQELHELKMKLNRKGSKIKFSEQEATGKKYQKPPRPLRVGDTVELCENGMQATIISMSEHGKNMIVQAGMLKINTKSDKVLLVEEPVNVRLNDKGSSKSHVDTQSIKSAMELDVRGSTVDEAVVLLDAFLDNAVLLRMENVTIIHGKGTGALRAGIQSYLKQNKLVKSFRLGTYGEGESGVTVVTLK